MSLRVDPRKLFVSFSDEDDDEAEVVQVQPAVCSSSSSSNEDALMQLAYRGPPFTSGFPRHHSSLFSSERHTDTEEAMALLAQECRDKSVDLKSFRSYRGSQWPSDASAARVESLFHSHAQSEKDPSASHSAAPKRRKPDLLARARLCSLNKCAEGKQRQKYVNELKEMERQKETAEVKPKQPSKKSLEASNRLYAQAKEIEQQHRSEALQAQKRTAEEAAQYSFRPTISKHSRRLASESRGYTSPAARSPANTQSKRPNSTAMLRLQKAAAELNACSFSPRISNGSQRIMQYRQTSPSTPIHYPSNSTGLSASERLYEEGRERRLRQQIAQRSMSPNERRQPHESPQRSSSIFSGREATRAAQTSPLQSRRRSASPQQPKKRSVSFRVTGDDVQHQRRCFHETYDKFLSYSNVASLTLTEMQAISAYAFPEDELLMDVLEHIVPDPNEPLTKGAFTTLLLSFLHQEKQQLQPPPRTTLRDGQLRGAEPLKRPVSHAAKSGSARLASPQTPPGSLRAAEGVSPSQPLPATKGYADRYSRTQLKPQGQAANPRVRPPEVVALAPSGMRRRSSAVRATTKPEAHYEAHSSASHSSSLPEVSSSSSTESGDAEVVYVEQLPPPAMAAQRLEAALNLSTRETFSEPHNGTPSPLPLELPTDRSSRTVIDPPLEEEEQKEEDVLNFFDMECIDHLFSSIYRGTYVSPPPQPSSSVQPTHI